MQLIILSILTAINVDTKLHIFSLLFEKVFDNEHAIIFFFFIKSLLQNTKLNFSKWFQTTRKTIYKLIKQQQLLNDANVRKFTFVWILSNLLQSDFKQQL